MGLTPTAWSSYAERREAPFRSEGGEAWHEELRERIATWEAWVFELGGRRFVEPPAASPPPRFTYVLVTRRGESVVKTQSRAIALGLLSVCRDEAIDVTLEVERPPPARPLFEGARRRMYELWERAAAARDEAMSTVTLSQVVCHRARSALDLWIARSEALQ